jgi:hypothetical protein
MKLKLGPLNATDIIDGQLNEAHRGPSPLPNHPGLAHA